MLKKHKSSNVAETELTRRKLRENSIRSFKILWSVERRIGGRDLSVESERSVNVTPSRCQAILLRLKC